MTHTQQRIEEIRKNGYQLNLSDVFNHAFKNYKKTALYAGLSIFVLYLILGVFGFALLVYVFGIENLTRKNPPNLQITNLSGEQLLVIYMSSMVLVILFGALFTAGFYKMADCADKNEKFNVFTIFYYFRLPYLANIIGATLLIPIVEVSVSVWLETLGLSFLGTVISLLISLFTCLTIPLIVFGKLNTIKAIKTSFMIVSKQPLMLTGLLIVSVIGAMVGVIFTMPFIYPIPDVIDSSIIWSFLFYIGVIVVIFTIPFIYSMTYAIYSSIIGLEIEKPDSNPEISS